MKLPGQDAMARGADENARVKLPRRVVEQPLRQVAKRLLMALGVLVLTVVIVYIDREGYHDNADSSVDLLDAGGGEFPPGFLVGPRGHGVLSGRFHVKHAPLAAVPAAADSA